MRRSDLHGRDVEDVHNQMMARRGDMFKEMDQMHANVMKDFGKVIYLPVIVTILIFETI